MNLYKILKMLKEEEENSVLILDLEGCCWFAGPPIVVENMIKNEAPGLFTFYSSVNKVERIGEYVYIELDITSSLMEQICK